MLLNLITSLLNFINLILKNHLSPLQVSIKSSSTLSLSHLKSIHNNEGVESVSMDMKGKKLTITGDIDPVPVVAKLRKFCHTEIISVGPAKEEKKDESKRDDKKKDSTKEKVIDPIPLMFYGTHYNQMKPQYNPYYSAVSVEEDPNSCVII